MHRLSGEVASTDNAAMARRDRRDVHGCFDVAFSTPQRPHAKDRRSLSAGTAAKTRRGAARLRRHPLLPNAERRVPLPGHRCAIARFVDCARRRESTPTDLRADRGDPRRIQSRRHQTVKNLSSHHREDVADRRVDSVDVRRSLRRARRRVRSHVEGQSARRAFDHGAGICLWALARLQLGTSFSGEARATALVTTGLYSKIRNPIYVFGGIFLVGLFTFIDPYLLLLLLVIVPVQIVRLRKEAAVLEAAFGDAYRDYKRQTWF